jgi:cystinosin
MEKSMSFKRNSSHDGKDAYVMPRFLNIDIDAWCIPISIIFGIIVGVSVPGNSDLSEDYRPVSSIIGWTYFFSWTLSFYPQIILNAVRKNTIGMMSDKLAYDIIGFSCLSVYTIAMYGVPSIREQYRDNHQGNNPVVQINDVCFAVHAFVCTIIQIGQMVVYNGMAQLPSKLCLIGCGITMVMIALYLTVCVVVDEGVFILINWLYFISFVKIGITLVKYIPQMLHNRERKCTHGWSINAVLLDFNGSVLSIIQLILDCNNTGDWTGITGNLVKMALGLISLAFDAIFTVQHYCLYPSHHLSNFQYQPLANEALLGEDFENIDSYRTSNPLIFNVGDSVKYRGQDGNQTTAIIMEVHRDDTVPYYTISLKNGTKSGVSIIERQTDGSRLEPIYENNNAPSWVIA